MPAVRRDSTCACTSFAPTRRGGRQRGRAPPRDPTHRDGGQAQYIEAPVAPDPDDDRITQSIAWAAEHLADAITVQTLARRAHMSPRTYLRHFARCTGTSPIRWLIGQRVHASLPLLERTQVSIEEIAATVGFGTATTYRHHFGQTMQTSPSAYRRTFQTRAQAGRHSSASRR